VTAAATVLKFNNEFKIRILTPLFCWLIPTTSKANQYKNGESLTYFGYTEYPMKALNEMRKLTNIVRSNLHKVKNPALLIHAKFDLASVMENYHIVKKGISSKVSRDIILENSTHNLFATGPEQSMIFENVLTFLKENNSL
jgi:carboxylesterase